MNFTKDIKYMQDGSLTWISTRHNAVKVGQTIGYVHNDGYIAFEYEGKGYLAHRVVWYLHHGAWPKGEIDHINGNKQDNRIENLRDVPKSDNLLNSYKHRAGKLGGCSYDKRRGTWKSKIVLHGVEYYLGSYDTEEEAHLMYLMTKIL